MKRRDVLHLIAGTLGLGILASCEEEYSVYQNELGPNRRDLTIKNLNKLKLIDPNKTSLKIAFVADTHNYYDEFNKAVDLINLDNEIDFIIHLGDMTDRGYEKEYKFSHDIISRFNKPYLTAIGNHEYFTQNGGSLYRTMFGEVNYSFRLLDKKFIFFDNNRDVATIDIDWLEREVKNLDGAKDVYVIAHAPTVSFTFFGAEGEIDKQRIEEILNHPNVKLTIFGHEHYHHYDEDDKWLFVDYMKNKNFIVMNINSDSYDFERVFF